MRFPKSVVQVRECGIALDIFYPVISVAQILARVSANADARALLFMFTQRVSGNAGEASRFRPGIFSHATRFRIKACRCRRLSGGPDGTSLKNGSMARGRPWAALPPFGWAAACSPVGV